VPDGVFVNNDEGLRFEMLPVPTSANVLAILDRIMRRIARRLAKDATNGELVDDMAPDVLAQVQAEAARMWKSPTDVSAPVRGVIAEHDRDALERLCRYGARPAFALERLGPARREGVSIPCASATKR
jgi:hypothetical protein